MKNDEVAQLVVNLTACMKELRLQQGLSHEVLADKCGLTRQSIGMIEGGQRIPSIASCLRVAKGLDTSLQHLLDMAEGKKLAKPN